MKFDVLHNFISPVTGRVLADYNYVLVGNAQGIAIPSPILIDIRLDLINLRKRHNTLVDADFVVGHENEEIPNAQVLVNLANGYMVNIDGIVSTTDIIPIGDLPDLTYKHLWMGNLLNRPIEVLTILLENLPDLTSKKIWRGNLLDRPIEVDDLTTLEEDMSNALAQLASLASLVSSLVSTVAGIQSALAALEAGLASVGGWVGIALMQTQILGLIAAVAATNARIDNLRLNNIPADADVSLYDFKIINLADPVNPQDAVNLRTLEASVGAVMLEGFVEGGPPVGGVITTVRGPDCLLTNIPAGGDVDMDEFRIKNLQQSPIETLDAISAQFLWDLMHDEVEVIWL